MHKPSLGRRLLQRTSLLAANAVLVFVAVFALSIAPAKNTDLTASFYADSDLK